MAFQKNGPGSGGNRSGANSYSPFYVGNDSRDFPDAKALCAALGGRWHGSYGIAFCPAHDNRRTEALSLGQGQDGRLLAYCHAGCTFLDILDALRARGLLSNNGRPMAHLTGFGTVASRRPENSREDQHKRAVAERLWRDGLPVTGTLGERYLRARAIRGELPRTLRFAPACRHPGTGLILPAMLAIIERGGELAGVHRTYLAEPGRKADVPNPKCVLGRISGGAVRVCEGSEGLVIAEGIEDALSIRDALHGHNVAIWAAPSAAHLGLVQLPDNVRRLVIAPDRNEPGLRGAEKLAQRGQTQGLAVLWMRQPEGRDWNDVAREAGHEPA